MGTWWLSSGQQELGFIGPLGPMMVRAICYAASLWARQSELYTSAMAMSPAARLRDPLHGVKSAIRSFPAPDPGLASRIDIERDAFGDSTLFIWSARASDILTKVIRAKAAHTASAG